MKRLFVLFSLFSVAFACKKDKSSEVIDEVSSTLTYCDTVTVSFVNQIKPIFNQNCSTSGCHSVSAAASGYIYVDYNQISDDSNLTPALKAIRHESSSSPMPKSAPKLNDSMIQQIECWISQGKLNN